MTLTDVTGRRGVPEIDGGTALIGWTWMAKITIEVTTDKRSIRSWSVLGARAALSDELTPTARTRR